jgi:hypothetical protein
MRCLRVRLVTGPREAQGISQDHTTTVLRNLVERGQGSFSPRSESSESSGEPKKPRGAPGWRARVRKDAGSALKARTKIDLIAVSALRPLWGNGKRDQRAARRSVDPGCGALALAGCLTS